MSRRLLVLVVAVCALSCPAAAGAHSVGHYLMRPHRAIRFRLQGTAGYTIEVAENSRRNLEVTVRRGPVTTAYGVTAPRSESPERVRGTVGALGSFDVRFTPRGSARRLPRYAWCTGPGPTIQPGMVRGSIRFQAENDYTEASARRASAELETMPGQRCHFGETGHSKRPHRYTATMYAAEEEGDGGAYLDARRFAPGRRPSSRRVTFEAGLFQQVGPVAADRSVRVTGDASTFSLPRFDTAPENAVIRPPAPFTGSATFARTAESTFSWTGDLAVDFPGVDPIPLTGPLFSLHYCAALGCVDQDPPGFRLERPPG